MYVLLKVSDAPLSLRSLTQWLLRRPWPTNTFTEAVADYDELEFLKDFAARQSRVESFTWKTSHCGTKHTANEKYDKWRWQIVPLNNLKS